MKKILLALLIVLLLFVAYLLYNAINFSSSQIQVEPIDKITVPENAINRFAEAISIRTISFENAEDFDSAQFDLFNEFLIESYPGIYALPGHLIFNKYSHLFKWEGTNTSLKPIVLMAHLDAVPIASPALWNVHPFTTGVKKDTIYGRGSMDDKCSLISILEATEQLLNEGHQPQRTIYVALGHDEEVLGKKGAVEIARHLEKEGIEASFVLDEGMAITQNMMPGLEGEVAMIGVAEKGFLSLELEVHMAGGHSSSPEKETSIDVLALAVSKLKRNPSPAKLTPVLKDLFQKSAPEMGFSSKLAFGNLFLFQTLILGKMEKSKSGNAMIRTTTSPTIFEAGIKENVIPIASRAVVNFRILPGETVEDVIAHAIKTINDNRVNVFPLQAGTNPSPISPSDNHEYLMIERSIKEVFNNIITIPSLVIGATDSRHFTKISPNVYRFVPYKISPKNIECFHGIDERVPVSEFKDAIRFYRRVILNSDQE
ncbi:MAG: carboxypeptidase PM20D1 [Saprospiraceae bacterium]|jgi:carboxypeptidase PM20D1